MQQHAQTVYDFHSELHASNSIVTSLHTRSKLAVTELRYTRRVNPQQYHATLGKVSSTYCAEMTPAYCFLVMTLAIKLLCKYINPQHLNSCPRPLHWVANCFHHELYYMHWKAFSKCLHCFHNALRLRYPLQGAYVLYITLYCMECISCNIVTLSLTQHACDYLITLHHVLETNIYSIKNFLHALNSTTVWMEKQ